MDNVIFRPLVIWMLTLIFAPAPLLAQPEKADKNLTVSSQSASSPKQLDPNFVRWRVYLDTLAQEARSVPDERRPYVVTDVALAYWEFDRDEATRLVLAAADEASRLAEGDKNYRDLVDFVLNTASKVDVELLKQIRKRLAEKEGDKKYIWLQFA